MCLQRPIDLVDNLGNRLDSMDFVDHDNDTCDYFLAIGWILWILLIMIMTLVTTST